MIRVRIERVVVDGLPHLDEVALRRDLERELALAVGSLETFHEPRRAGVVTRTENEAELAVDLAQSLRGVLGS